MDLNMLMKQNGEKRQAVMNKIQNAQSGEELDAAEFEIRKLELEKEELQRQMAEEDSAPEKPEIRKAGEESPIGDLNPIFSFRNKPVVDDGEDIYDTLEYRKAFKNYVIAGAPLPEKYIEKRASEMTTVGDITAIIPTTIQNRVIEDITTEGKILSRINQTAYKGGVEIPLSEINFTASWLESEDTVSEEQKAEMKARLVFGYHVLEARVAIGLLSATVSLPLFEATIVKQLKKAMVKAIETAIVEGSGVGQPLGFTKYNLPSEQVITMTEGTISKVATWASVEAAIPEAYEDTVIYVMSKATWEMYLNGMTDTTGQKIGLGKINEKGQKILNGRQVLTVDKFPSFSSAPEGAIWGAVIDLSRYCLNSNLAMHYKRYFDDDKNKWIHKALMIADGKMMIGEIDQNGTKKLVGAKGLLYLKK